MTASSSAFRMLAGRERETAARPQGADGGGGRRGEEKGENEEKVHRKTLPHAPAGQGGGPVRGRASRRGHVSSKRPPPAPFWAPVRRRSSSGKEVSARFRSFLCSARAHTCVVATAVSVWQGTWSRTAMSPSVHPVSGSSCSFRPSCCSSTRPDCTKNMKSPASPWL